MGYAVTQRRSSIQVLWKIVFILTHYMASMRNLQIDILRQYFFAHWLNEMIMFFTRCLSASGG